MKNILPILLLFFHFLTANAQIVDNFSDGNFNSSPKWEGDTAFFKVNTALQLQSKTATSTQTVSLATGNTFCLNTMWQFYVQMDFDPSTSNQMRIYLVSNKVDLKAPLNGYFIQIGENGASDSYDLYRQNGSSITKIIDGPPKLRALASELKANIRISCDNTGKWTLETDQLDGTGFKTEGSVIDQTFTSSTYFGINLTYTATRSDKFYFDDLQISMLKNIPPPKPIYQAKFGDVVFNELFPDPSPQIDLPTTEFIELYNTSDSLLFFDGWQLSDASSIANFPADSIRPKEYVILCARADTAEFKRFGKTIGLSPWPSLNNAGDLLTLKRKDGTIIDRVNYTDSWYRDVNKKAGGYTLELIDSKSPCTGARNWIASNDISGGTPGKINSASQSLDTIQFRIDKFTRIDNVSINLHFSLPTDSSSLVNSQNYQLTELVRPITLIPTTSLFDEVVLTFAKPFEAGKNYELSINTIAACKNQTIPFQKLSFFIPYSIQPNEILINEILFNPRPNGADFVEIYNNSFKTFDLAQLELGSINSKDSLYSKPICSSSILFKPGEYLAITLDPENIKTEYQPKNPDPIIKPASMPTYNDDKGVVFLKSQGQIIDRFDYNEKMHFALIHNPEGVSLERVSFNRPANDNGNFHSASSAVGYATPGYKNSQSMNDIDETSQEITLAQSIISPDNDGIDDFITLNYHFDKPGTMANITIYDAKGRLVRKLSNNELLGTEGSIIWDGLNDKQQPITIGPHMINIEVFKTDGNVSKFRKVCLVAGKLN
ncbi:lamin tail domain-containing protein [Solitalea koreensis]|uniref:Lamin Tail Domain n=1 Tax=Solitalea koreensis TaxID=543615 RepID=A0A521CJL5_9SPHI|nr:lamin tail domain-containing protein [Solitalea koreensis]SMO59628.1 Lamin Tail Domain [Solitalea koreensis]